MIVSKLNSNTPISKFNEVARLHISEIHFGFLPLLGDEFLSYLYFQLAQIDKTGLWVAEENDEISGFILGTADFRKSYLDVFKKSWLALIIKGIPSIFKRSVLSKLPAVMLYPFKNHEASTEQTHRNSNAELLSIAVNKNSQGKGIGKGLVLALESELGKWDFSGDYFVTTNAADPDSTAFYMKLGFIPCGFQKHNDLTLQVFSKTINPRSEKG